MGGAITLIPDTPKDILTRLNLLLGTRHAGNNSLDIRNEIVQLIDIAAAKNVMTSEDKKRLNVKNNLNQLKIKNIYTIYTLDTNKNERVGNTVCFQFN